MANEDTPVRQILIKNNQGCRIAGAETIIAVEPNAAKRDLAMELGATHTIDPKAEDARKKVREITMLGSHYAFEAIGRIDTVEQMWGMIRPNGLAVVVGVPIGFIMGMSPAFRVAWQPLIQILRPVSPLAWLPIGLLLFRAVDPSAIFVIFITCIWPTLVNTAAGVQAVPKDFLNVAAVLRLGKWEIATKILLPATLPYIITGMRLSLGIAWMVIVAAEMLTGGIGIGFYIWDEWNNLNVPSIIVCIILIGLVGIVLEGIMSVFQKRFDYNLR